MFGLFFKCLVVDNFQTTLPIRGGGRVILDIWDTAGQEDLESIRILSYPNTKVTMFCYSCVSLASLQNIEHLWLKETDKVIPDTPFVLVGTKLDLATEFPDKAVASEVGERLCENHNGYEHIQCSSKSFSAKNDSNVKLAFSLAVSCYLNRLQEIAIGRRKTCREKCCCTLL